jgi:hypothetical protein
MLRRGDPRRWLLALGVQLLADAIYYFPFDAHNEHYLRRIGLAVTLFVPPLLLSIAAAQRIDALPLARGLWRRSEGARFQAQQHLLPAMPLVVGVGASYAAGAMWDRLRCWECARIQEVNSEFFSQMAQLIPLLLIALLIESGVLRVQIGDPAIKRAIAVYTVIMLVVAEALVFSALASPSLAVRLSDLHSYAAFTGAWFATGVAATSLIVLAATGVRDTPADGSK